MIPHRDHIEGPGKPPISTATKTTIVGGAGTGLAGYLALLAFEKWGIPMEFTFGVVALVGGLIGRWAGKLQP